MANRYGQPVDFDPSLGVQIRVSDVASFVRYADRIDYIQSVAFDALGAPWARPAKTIALENCQVDFDYPPDNLGFALAIAFPRGFA